MSFQVSQRVIYSILEKLLNNSRVVKLLSYKKKGYYNICQGQTFAIKVSVNSNRSKNNMEKHNTSNYAWFIV